MEMENDLKYIVYLTTNIVNNKIYIGVHKTITPYKFDGYLGNGVRIQDRHTYKYSKTPFLAAVNKYGVKNFKRKTLKVFNNLQEALEFETFLVDAEFIKRGDTYNVALGGGVPLIISKTIYQYTLLGEFVQKWPSITEAAIYYKCNSSTIGLAIFDRTPSMKFLWTDVFYEKINLNSFKIDANKTPCYLYDNQGGFLKEFKSISECSSYINIDIINVSKSIKGKYCLNKKYYCSDVFYKEFPIPVKVEHTKIYLYDLQGNFIKEWNSYKDVKLYFKKDVGIHAAIRLNNSCAGYLWSWEKLPNMKELKPATKARKVGKYTIDGILVLTFNTVREAKKDTSGAPGVLRGLRKTAGGYIWKYLD